jgi:hypothetical protein
MERFTVKVVDGEGRTVTTGSTVARSACKVAAVEADARAYLRRTRATWTHCSEDDRACWGFMVWDEAGTLVAHG